MALGGIIIYIQNLQDATPPAPPVVPSRLFNRRNWLYRPRRGMMVSGRQPASVPTGMFIGSAAVTRTRCTPLKKTFVITTTDSLDIGGDVMTSAVGPSGCISRSGP